MLDLTKPLALTERVRLNRDEPFDPSITPYQLSESKERIRVLATDRICPVNFSVVIGVYDQRAYFGPEEFIYTVNPKTQAVSGQGLVNVYLVNVPE